jgi:Domain of unknown function (DUF4407)
MIDLLENIKGILIFCSGADRETLTDTKLSSEENKYVTIGALIILTTLLAGTSGGTAAHKFFGGNFFVTALVVVFWGAFIFFLERYFMMSTKKFQVNDDLWGIYQNLLFPVCRSSHHQNLFFDYFIFTDCLSLRSTNISFIYQGSN